MSDRLPVFVITCEHGGNEVPEAYADLFRDHRALLESHRGFDVGALELGRLLATQLRAPFFHAVTTRLLVDLNRSPGNKNLFSALTRTLPESTRKQLLEGYYYLHRDRIDKRIAALVAGGNRVVHIAAHSFTPILNGVERRADVGLLYDPRREHERLVANVWQRCLQRLRPDLVVRRNYPYQGKADGMSTWLRRKYPDDVYAGLELEVNQRWATSPASAWQEFVVAIAKSAELVYENVQAQPAQ